MHAIKINWQYHHTTLYVLYLARCIILIILICLKMNIILLMNFIFKYLFSQRPQINSKEPLKELQQQDKQKGKVIYAFSFETV